MGKEGKRRSRSKKRRERSRSRSRSYKKCKTDKNDLLDLQKRLEYLERKASSGSSHDRSPGGSACGAYSYSSRGWKSSSRSGRSVSKNSVTLPSSSRSEVPDRSPRGSARHSRRDIETPCNFTPLPEGNQVSPNGGQDTLELRLDEETLASLGLNSTGMEVKKVSLHPDLAKVWANNVTKGNKAEYIEAIIKEFPTPENCPQIQAPELNKDIRHMLVQSINKRDHAIYKKDNIRVQNQNKLGACIAGVGEIITDILNNENEHVFRAYLQKLGKIGTMLTDLQYDISVSRRATISCILSKEAKQAAEESELDCYLFGSDFSEKFKSLQVLNKSSKDLKANFVSTNNNELPEKPSANYITSKVHLNRRAPSRNMRERQRHKGHNPRGQFPQERGSRRNSYRR